MAKRTKYIYNLILLICGIIFSQSVTVPLHATVTCADSNVTMQRH